MSIDPDEWPAELVAERDYERRKRANDRLDPRDPAYDDRFDHDEDGDGEEES